jgi:hypothetical protein
VRDGAHYRDGWLTNNHRTFLATWKGYRESITIAGAAASNDERRLSKKPRIAVPTAYLKSQLTAAVKQVEGHMGDQYEQWKRLVAIAEDDLLAYNPLQYWQLQSGQYPTLSKFAINILTISASAAD